MAGSDDDYGASWSATSFSDLAPFNNFREHIVLSKDECAEIIAAAEVYTAGVWGLRGDYFGHTTMDVDATMIGSLSWLSNCVAERFIGPLVAAFQATEGCLDTLRVVKYEGASSCAGLPLHSDGTPLSFVCPLNDVEGGTYVRVLQRVISPAAGHALLFCGQWMHAGVPVAAGTVRYVLAGFVRATFDTPMTAALERLVACEQHASSAPRLCSVQRRFLRRAFAAFDGEPAARACTRCAAHVPRHAVRHCCDYPGCCGTRWCDACLHASSPHPPLGDVADADEPGCELECEFIADISLADGALVAPGAVVKKVWRLGMGASHWELEDPHRRPRIVRGDHDTDESVGSRCLGEEALTLVATRRGLEAEADDDDEAEGGEVQAPQACSVDASVELVAPTRPGAYRAFFRLVGPTVQPVAGTDELFADFFVGVRDDTESYAAWRANQLVQRQRLGVAITRSWEGALGAAVSPAAGGTLVIAFAGADARIPGPVPGGVPAHEFVKALRAVQADTALFVRDVNRAWYLRGVGERGHDFRSVCETLRKEIDAVRPSRVVTLGCSMGGYAALRAAIAINADAAVAFAPQVVVDPHERARMRLPRMDFDSLLEALAAVGRDEGFELRSLVECVSDAAAEGTAMRPTHLEVHVGDRCPGDVTEARLLEVACSQSGLGLTCRCVVHAGHDHCLAASMKQSGELHNVLARLVGSAHHPQPHEPDTDDTSTDHQHVGESHQLHHSARELQAQCNCLPEDFVGFEDCDDF